MIRPWPWMVRSSQQRALDEASIRSGISADVLMESAGLHAAEWMLRQSPLGSVAVLVGPGGNGGDALVVARYLKMAGIPIQVFCRRGIESLASLSQQMGERFTQLGDAAELKILNPRAFHETLQKVNTVIDGLFGSGLSRPLRGDDAEVCEMVNASDTTRISLDVPSGIDADSGAMPGASIRAHITLAMAFYKPCHWLHPAAACCGAVNLVGVDYPPNMLETIEPMAFVPTKSSIAALLPGRRATGHKGTFGRVLIVAGSQGMTGAAILCARGALRAGAGLVTVALPESIAPVIQAAVPEATTLPLPDCDGRLVASSASCVLASALPHADVIAIGPGLGRDSTTQEIVRYVLAAFPGKLVVDADALHALVKHDGLFSSLAGRAVLTPHPGEFAALTGSAASDVDADRLDRVAAFMAEHETHLVLKGRPTVIGLPDGSLVINPTGNTGLATGGSGDVLTGLMAGLMAGGGSLDDAAVASAYVHGLIADQWAMEFSERSLTPSDILEMLPRVLKELET